MNVLELVCPVCKTNKFDERYKKDGLYVCANLPRGEEGGICGKIVAIYCKGCKHNISENNLGLRGDVYECKECGKPHWGYTEWKRDRLEIEKYITEHHKKMNEIIFNLKNRK